MRVSGNTSIGDLRKAFNRQFPYLKLGLCYSWPIRSNGAQTVRNLTDQDRLYDLVDFIRDQELLISGRMQATDLLHALHSKLCLGAEIFQRSRHSWVRVPQTNTTTLEKLNATGRAISHAIYDHELL